jgi:hypothetical protein
MQQNVSQIINPAQVIAELTPHTPLLLSIETHSQRTIHYKGQFVGVDAPSHLILKTLKNLSPQTSAIPQIGNYISVRCKSEHAVIGFRSRITAMLRAPNRWMVINYPKSGFDTQVRKAPRYPAYLLANANLSPMFQMTGVIKDISLHGCMFVSLVPQREPNLNPGTQLEVQTRLPMLDTPITLKGQVRHTRNHAGQNVIGIEFIKPYKIIAIQLARHQQKGAKLALTA